MDGSSSYDIRTTDSIVSPLVGTVELAFTCERSFFDSREEAERYAGPAAQTISPCRKCRFTYALQEGRWVLKSIEEEDYELDDFDMWLGAKQCQGLWSTRQGSLP